MQSLERAAALLRGATSLDGLAAILYELGFSAPALPLDYKARLALGLCADARAARIAQGKGCLRGLALELNGDANSRQTLKAIASAVSRNSPQLLWIIVSRGVATADVAIVSGVKPGDQVVTGPFRLLKKLKDGDKVEISKEEKKPQPGEKA